ncbi:MAG: TMEM175 family protein [Hyphomonadaceae bacterium]
MQKERLLAFTDGVLAIVITIMVLELRPPHEVTLAGLGAVAPVFLAYVLSFIYLAIYWNNHHHMMVTVERVNGAILWANMHLLFWLSLVPFTTAWFGETGGAMWPTVVYGASLLAAALAYYILQTLIVRSHGPGHMLKRAIGWDWKGTLSPVFYLIGIAASFADPRFGYAMYILVAIIWLVPDRRIERALTAP